MRVLYVNHHPFAEASELVLCGNSPFPSTHAAPSHIDKLSMVVVTAAKDLKVDKVVINSAPGFTAELKIQIQKTKDNLYQEGSLIIEEYEP